MKNSFTKIWHSNISVKEISMVNLKNLQSRLFLVVITIFLLKLGSSKITAQNADLKKVEANIDNIIHQTITLNPIIQRQVLEIRRSEAEVQNSSSAFDWQLNSELSYQRAGNILLDLDPRKQIFNDIKNNDGQFRIGVQKRLRNSMTIQSGVDWARRSNSMPFDEFQQMQDPFLSSNSGNISLQVLQPLLNGRGRSNATVNEMVNKKIVEVNQANLVQTAAREVFNSVVSYWQYLGNYEVFRAYQANELRVKQLLDITKTLIEADKKPASEVLQIQADLAEKEGQTIIANQSLYLAQQQLLRTIGLNERSQLTPPKSEFPKPEITTFQSERIIEQLYDDALNDRKDLTALKLNQEALSLVLAAAENQLSPKLDLSGVVGYGGLEKGNAFSNILTSFAQEAGSNWFIGGSLSFTFPLQNNQAKAQLNLQKIALQDQHVLLDNEERNIKINVNNGLNNLKQSYAAVLKGKEALDYYIKAFENEKEKFQNGLTILINLIRFQERLTFSEIQYIQLQQQFAIDLTTLQFETGSLIKKSELEKILFDKKPNESEAVKN